MLRGYTSPSSKTGRIIVIALVILLIIGAAFLFFGKTKLFSKKGCELDEQTKVKAFDTMVGFYLWGVEDSWFKTRSNQEISAMALSETAKKLNLSEKIIKDCWTTSRGVYSPNYSKMAKIKGGIQL